ncbi:MAG: hypothetical protein U9P73_03415 [Candidatus Cloacimonadota bacterium]|nr:hypothetical protein [Candidatus Cloacimonadota bacterium]
MKKSILLMILLIVAMSLFGEYNIGDIVANYFWTDNTGASHDIYELTAQGVAIVFFWGGTG